MKQTIQAVFLVLLVFYYADAKDSEVEEMKNSKSLIEKIKKLPEISLPDEWYLQPNDLTLDEKFSKVAEKQASFSLEDMPISDRLLEVKQKYCNNNKPFKHTVNFNSLVSAEFPESSYSLTIVSCKEEVYTTLEALEILEFEKRNKELSSKKQELLLRILK